MARVKTFVNDGDLFPADLNDIQDDYDARLQALSALVGGKDGSLRRGKSVIATTEVLTAPTSYSFAATPDRVENIVLPTDGLIHVAFMATWQETVAGAARAAIFLGSDQAKIVARSGPAAYTQAGATGSGAAVNIDTIVTSCASGLVSLAFPGAGAADVTTGQILGVDPSATAYHDVNGSAVANGGAQFGLGGFCSMFAAAGTYTVGIKFKAASGNVTVKRRRLYVVAEGY